MRRKTEQGETIASARRTSDEVHRGICGTRKTDSSAAARLRASGRVVHKSRPSGSRRTTNRGIELALSCATCSAAFAEWEDEDECEHTLAPLPTPHDLRHTYASDMLRTGRTARAVADLLGHADVSLVLRVYAHTLPDELSNAAEDLDRWRAEHC